MNPDTLKFEPVTAETPSDWRRFEIGEIMTLFNHTFRLDRIYTDGIRLRLANHRQTLPVLKSGQQIMINGVMFNLAHIYRNSIVLHPTGHSTSELAGNASG